MIDPMLAGLNDNGGPTQTMALLSGSPALDTGDPSLAGAPDQRGVFRFTTPNIGAYEAAPAVLLVTSPTDVAAGQPFDVTVTAVDAYRQPAVGYTGTVDLLSSDPADPFLGEYTFTLADAGQYTFSGVVQGTPGMQTLSASDSGNGLYGTLNIVVESPGAAARSKDGTAQAERAREAAPAGLIWVDGATRHRELLASSALAAPALPPAHPPDAAFLSADLLASLG